MRKYDVLVLDSEGWDGGWVRPANAGSLPVPRSPTPPPPSSTHNTNSFSQSSKSKRGGFGRKSLVSMKKKKLKKALEKQGGDARLVVLRRIATY